LRTQSAVGDGKDSFISTYIDRVRSFSPNARLYLTGAVIYGTVMGVFQLLFNFYMLSLGYDEVVIGNLVTIRSATSLVAALPMGYLTDRIGRKNAFFFGYITVGFSVAMMLVAPKILVLNVMNVLMGFGQSLSMVAMGPFLMENSTEKERTYLFSFSSGIGMVAASIGQWLGGYLPTWMGSLFKVSASSSTAYAWSLSIIIVGTLLALVPNLMMTRNRLLTSERSVFAPLEYMKVNPGGLTRLITPMLITSIGAGMIMPFMNLFFRNVHLQSDAVIGTMFAWGSLAMAIGLLIAPALAEKYGKIEIVVLTQALSVPFLALLGFSPIFTLSLVAYYVRIMLMNMSSPVYSTFVMEQVDGKYRAMVASLSSMANQFGWAFSPTISGFIQVRYGFKPAFMLTIVFYVIAISMYYVWFWKNRKPVMTAEPTAQQNETEGDGVKKAEV